MTVYRAWRQLDLGPFVHVPYPHKENAGALPPWRITVLAMASMVSVMNTPGLLATGEMPDTITRLGPVLLPLLPTPEQTNLLRAALLSGEDAWQAWQAWRKPLPDVRQALGHERLGSKRLLPLLYRAMQRNSVPLESELTTFLRMAYARETMRGDVYRRACHDVLKTLTDGGLPYLVLKGAALVSPYYDDWALRHCHDLDLLIAPHDLPRAATLLQAAQDLLQITTRDGPEQQSLVAHHHASGLPITIHTQLFPHPHYLLSFADLWARSLSTTVAGVTVRTLSSADHLIHICGLASCSPGRVSLQWACDAWHIVEHAPDLEWDALVHHARRGHLDLPLSIFLDLPAPDSRRINPRRAAGPTPCPAYGGDNASCWL